MTLRELSRWGLMNHTFPKTQSISVGVVVRRSPGQTRWMRYIWRPVAVIPGAGEANWKVLRQEGDVIEYHAATLPLDLFVADTESYVHELQARVPSIYVVLRPDEGDETLPWSVALVTASPYEAQDYCDSAEELVEKIPMSEGMLAWVGSFVDKHHEEEEFVKRRRKNMRTDGVEPGVGDPRIAQETDVYRAPRRKEAMN